MNRKSIIAIVVALALILTGTGYAYWTDTLNVTTKATTGDMDVTFVDLGLYAKYDNELISGANNWTIIDGIADGYAGARYFGNAGYNEIAAGGSDGANALYRTRADGFNSVDFDAQLNPEGNFIDVSIPGAYNPQNAWGADQILISVNEMYPGYAQAFRTDIANVGSIAARLSNIKFDVSSLEINDSSTKSALNPTTKKMLGIALYIDKEQYNEVGGDSYDNAKVFGLAEALGLTGDDYFTLGNVDFVRLSALPADFDPAQYISNQNLLALPSDNRMDLYFAIAMDPDNAGAYTTGNSANIKDNDDSLSQNIGAQISIDLLWDQFNAGVDAEATNWLQNQNRSTR